MASSRSVVLAGVAFCAYAHSAAAQTTTLNADYDFRLSNTLNAFAGAGISYRSKADSVIGGAINPPTAIPQTFNLFVLDDYALVDLRAGVRTLDGSWRLSVWGKNVFNAYYFNNVVAAFDTIGRYTGRPATYGATIGDQFR